MRSLRPALVLLPVLLWGCGGRSPDFSAVLAAEDARASTPAELQVLLDATRSGDAALREKAVRALGRLERPDLVDTIATHLDDPVPEVRGQAANALAQAVVRSDGTRVLDMLVASAHTETDPLVRGVIARSLGRLHLGGVGLGRVENTFAQLGEISSTLLELSHRPGGEDPSDSVLVMVALGMESFVRQNSETLSASGAMLDRLRELIETGLDRSDARPDAPYVRAMAATALGEAGALDGNLMRRALDDADADVRTDAARFLGKLPAADRRPLVRRALADPSQHVRVDALTALANGPLDRGACSILESEAERDSAASARLTALRGLERPCPDRASQTRLLGRIAASLDSADLEGWHEPAVALVGLAAVAPRSAEALLPRFTGHRSPFVRAWAAQAAGTLGRTSVLETLAADSSDNVRTAAVQALARLEGHGADSVLLAQLAGRDDPQILFTAANLLEGSPRKEQVAKASLSAFERISRAHRETWRDPRRALLARVHELGDSSLAPRLEPYLRDYDARVADDVAGVLSDWAHRQIVPHPEPLEPLALPSQAQLDSLEGARVLLHMRRGGTIEIRLFPDVAPTNAFRFARQVREGTFDGRTFHRVVPNFVIQGGSPSANEYQGSPLYTRDELGLLVNWRGRVGLSTRGRDTGDGQIYINLVDNVRLDHEYTVWGEVVSGMDVVDAVQEGDVIEHAEVRAGG